MRRQVVIFCGGSGASQLVRTFTEMDQVDLTVIVNCYDDGLSTGALRAYIPGMLGPSDVRKNVAHSLRRDKDTFAGLDHILGLRFRDDLEGSEILACPVPALRRAGAMACLSRHNSTLLTDAVERFASYMESRDRVLPLADVSLGNVLFAGIYLGCRDFNATVRAFTKFAGVRTRILNVTDGSDLKLLGLTSGGHVVPNESGISWVRQSDKLIEVFLLERYLTEDEVRLVDGLGKQASRKYLAARDCVPRINLEASDAIRNADVIVYWPGTQHSSLLPSYLTDGLAEAIVGSRARRKVLVTNAWKDNDIYDESAYSLVDKFFWFMSRRGRSACDSRGLVTDMLLSRPCLDTLGRALPLGCPTQPYEGAAIHVGEWSDERGKHVVSRVLAWLR